MPLATRTVLADKPTVGKNDFREQILQEKAVTRQHFGRRGQRVEIQRKALRDFFRDMADRRAFLYGACKVKAAKDRFVLEWIVFEQGGDKCPQRRLDCSKLVRKSQQARRHGKSAVCRHVRDAHLAQTVVQLFETLIEIGDQVSLAVRVVRQGRAPYALAFVFVGVPKKIDEPGNQVRFGKNNVDRGIYFQVVCKFLHALAQILGQANDIFRFILGQLGNAGRDDDPVDRRLGTRFLQQTQETQPFLAVFLIHRIASSRIEQNAFGRKEPVAVSGAPDPLNDISHFIRERKTQAGIDNRRALARCRVANHHVPGQFIQGRAPGQVAQLGGFDGFNRLVHAFAQLLDFLAPVIHGMLHRLISLLIDHVGDLV